MAAEGTVRVIAELTGLDQDDRFVDNGSEQTTPTATTGRQYRTLATADTAEALDIGDLSTATLIVLKAIDNDLDVDLDFDTSFDADLTIEAGGPSAVIPSPAGTVYVKNHGAGETVKYSYLAWGTT